MRSMRGCPKCGANKDKHGKWLCRSFPHGAEFRQSVKCECNELRQQIDALTAERNELTAYLAESYRILQTAITKHKGKDL